MLYNEVITMKIMENYEMSTVIEVRFSTYWRNNFLTNVAKLNPIGMNMTTKVDSDGVERCYAKVEFRLPQYYGVVRDCISNIKA